MKPLMILASIVSLGWISASIDTGMDSCLSRHSFATCHHTLNR
jgi:hypothetical protein